MLIFCEPRLSWLDSLCSKVVYFCISSQSHLRHLNPQHLLRAKGICRIAPTLIFQGILVHYAKIPFCPQPWQEELRMDLSEIHNWRYRHRGGAIPYLINHGHVLYHMQDCVRKMWYRWELGSLRE